MTRVDGYHRRREVPSPSVEWMDDAACADRLDLPWLADEVPFSDLLAMTRVCTACPVRDACLSHVRQAQVTGGFWAGKDRTVSRQPVQAALVEAG